MRWRFGELWWNADFLRLWLAQTISFLGTGITGLALPLTAALTLGATPVQMGLLGALQYLPQLLVGLFAGVWVDRLRRRPILIGADLGRAVLLASIPLVALVGALRLEYLYAVTFLTGVLTVFFDVAYLAFLPSLVQREQLVEANSKLEVSRSVAQIAGPSLGGALVQLLTAPLAILLDAISFLTSALFLTGIRAPESRPTAPDRRPSLWGEIGEGLRTVVGHPLHRAMVGFVSTFNFFGQAMTALYVLYATRDLGIEPAVLGAILALFGPGALLGTLVVGPATQRFGLGPALVGAALLAGGANLLVPLASRPTILAVALLAAAQFLMGLATPILAVNLVSLRQAITPDNLQGRVNATLRVLGWSTLPLGALLGGTLGETIGLQPTLIVGGLGSLLASGWIFLTPIRRLQALPGLPPVPTARAGG